MRRRRAGRKTSSPGDGGSSRPPPHRATPRGRLCPCPRTRGQVRKRSCLPPLAKYERLCYDIAMMLKYLQGAGRRPAPLPWSLPHMSVLGESRENRPVAASGGCSPRPTTVRGRVGPERMLFRDKLFGAIRLRHGSLRYRYDFTTAHHSSLTVSLRLYYAFVTAPCLKTPKSG